MRHGSGIPILLVAALIASPVPALLPASVAVAQESEEREPGPADLAEAIEIAEKHTGGKAAAAETVVREGREVHEVRVLLNDGRVRTVRVDPDTGNIIPAERRER